MVNEMKIYVVIGTTGEYSDRQVWIVKAFYDENKAEQFMIPLNALGNINSRTSKAHIQRAKKELFHLDPNSDIDYTGTRYSTIEIELE